MKNDKESFEYPDPSCLSGKYQIKYRDMVIHCNIDTKKQYVEIGEHLLAQSIEANKIIAMMYKYLINDGRRTPQSAMTWYVYLFIFGALDDFTERRRKR
jgi:hypothetical protein